MYSFPAHASPIGSPLEAKEKTIGALACDTVRDSRAEGKGLEAFDNARPMSVNDCLVRAPSSVNCMARATAGRADAFRAPPEGMFGFSTASR
jgi:hypothetical protein